MPSDSEPRTEAGRALLTELSESPLPGARYAHDVVSRRLAAIEEEAADEPARETDAAMNYGQGFAAGRAAALEEVRAVRGTIAIARGRVDAVQQGRGHPVVWQRLAEDLDAALAALTHPVEAEERSDD